jgi:hypothetical protein
MARLHYIRRLRDPARRAQKSQVDQDFIRAKIELIAIRVREKQASLMETETAIANMQR